MYYSIGGKGSSSGHPKMYYPKGIKGSSSGSPAMYYPVGRQIFSSGSPIIISRFHQYFSRCDPSKNEPKQIREPHYEPYPFRGK